MSIPRAISTGIALLALGVSRPAPAETDTVHTRAAMSGNALGVGAELGRTASLTAKYVLRGGRLSLVGGFGSHLLGGTGLHAHADAQWLVHSFARSRSISYAAYVDAGLRYYRHHFSPASIDETGLDTHTGIRAALGTSAFLSAVPLELFAELGPGLDLKRSNSCTLTSGTFSVCPHDSDTHLFFQFAVGARYYFPL